MASFLTITTFSTVPPTTATTAGKSHRRPKTYPKQTHRFRVSCNDTPDDKETGELIRPKTSFDTHNVDRRNLLLGLGAVNFASLSSVFAAPIMTPDLSTCVDANKGIKFMDEAFRGVACCPPNSKTEKAFIFPNDKVTRVRRAAHTLDHEYLAKYKAALAAMRSLPDDHPHSFVQQAKIHCAYCNGGYSQIASGYPDNEIQVHSSWLFFPFHRWYLYFYERILGKLINDPTFSLPYWNWDNPAGMLLPSFLVEEGPPETPNPAYDSNRNSKHLPPTIVDLNYHGTEDNYPSLEQINTNLTLMYKQMVGSSKDATSFFGGVFKAGEDPLSSDSRSVGLIESGCHTAVHMWTGSSSSTNKNHEDMGNFYSAGYDPAFYLHHSNVDRMWKIWKDLGIKGHTEPTDPDWLNASYLFYDENMDLVRVYNKDCVYLDKLKYDFEFSPIPWLKSRPTARKKRSKVARNSVGTVQNVQDVEFPLKLDKIVKVLVKRPAKSRSKDDKENAHELLMIKGIKFDAEKYVRFDVFVNDQDDINTISAFHSEFAGSFAQVPHNSGKKMFMNSGVRFGLTELLEDIETEDDEFILVTLVPKANCEELTISDIKVELVPIV